MIQVARVSDVYFRGDTGSFVAAGFENSNMSDYQLVEFGNIALK